MVQGGNMVLYVSLSIIGKLIPVLTCAGLLSPARHGTFLEDRDQGRWASRMGGIVGGGGCGLDWRTRFRPCLDHTIITSLEYTGVPRRYFTLP